MYVPHMSPSSLFPEGRSNVRVTAFNPELNKISPILIKFSPYPVHSSLIVFFNYYENFTYF